MRRILFTGFLVFGFLSSNAELWATDWPEVTKRLAIGQINHQLALALKASFPADVFTLPILVAHLKRNAQERLHFKRVKGPCGY